MINVLMRWLMPLMVALMVPVCAYGQQVADTLAVFEQEEVAALAQVPEPAPEHQDNGINSFTWIKQLFENGFHINDPGVDYPRFPRFALKVYNWGDRTFNSYDSTYVVGSGKNWKGLVKSYNWFENSTMFFFTDNTTRKVSMISQLFPDMGPYLCFMAVSVGYMFNLSDLIGSDAHRNTFNLDFTCSRFSINFRRQSAEGGMRLTRMGDYNQGHHIDYPFKDIKLKSTTLDAVYFFNHRRYSHAAAYCFSKYQLRSAGSWVAGFSYANQRFEMDFGSLPPEMIQNMPLPSLYILHHNDYTLTGGYAYNWVLYPRRWLINAMGTLALGYKHTSADATDAGRDMMAVNFRAMSSLTYNHRALFAGLQLRFDGFMYYNGQMFSFNQFGYITAMVGARF